MSQWIREGFSTYYVEEKQAELTYEKDILRQHVLDCLLPCEFRRVEEKEYYYYDTGGCHRFVDRINIIEPRSFFSHLFMCLQELEGYLLNLDCLVINQELLYIDEKQQPVLCYLPEEENNILVQIRTFLEQCVEQLSYQDKQVSRFYYEFHTFLSNEQPNMEQIFAFLKPEEELVVPEEWSQEEEPEENVVIPQKRNWINLGMKIAFLPLALGLAYMILMLYHYGFYYPYVIGFAVVLGLLIGLGVCVVKEQEPKKNVAVSHLDQEIEEGTERLYDEEKTELLLETPMGYLIGEDEGQETIVLGEGSFVVGSSREDTDYCLAKRGVSRRHAKFSLEGGEVLLQDLHSTNGTKVNGQKITSQVLKDGDRVTLAKEEYTYEKR